MLVVLALGGGVAAMLGGAAPTGLPVVDAVYVTAAGASVPLAASRSRRFTWLIGSLALLWMAPTVGGRLVAVAAVAASVWALRTDRRRWVGAAIGVGLAHGLSRLGAGPFLGSTTIAATLAVTPIAVSALRRLRPGQARLAAKAVTTVVGLAVVATLIFGVSVLWAAGNVRSAIDHAEAGFALASDGEQADATFSFNAAQAEFDTVRSKVGGIWTLPARFVPVVGQHARAIQVVASEGVSLTDSAAQTARVVDLDRIRISGSRLDLDAIDELAPILGRAEDAVTRAQDRIGDVDNQWLVGVVASRLHQLNQELAAAAPAARTAALAAAEFPEMLGANRATQWLVLLTTPAEARGLGGLVANYVHIEARDGEVAIVNAGRNEDLNAILRADDAELNAPAQYTARWGGYQPQHFFQDITLEPDMASVSSVAADLYRQATGIEVDGVVTVDPYVVQAILDLGGPVQVGDLRITDSNVVDFLLLDQYELFVDDEIGRVAALGALIVGTFDAFTGGALPGPRGIGAVIGPLIDADRINVWWAAGGGPAELIARTGLDGRFPDAAGADLIGVVHQNAGQNKLDTFLHRSIAYAVAVDGDDARATVTVEFANDAPTSGYPLAVIGSNDQGYPLGSNVALVTVHTALDLVELRVDGEAMPADRQPAFGGDAISVELEIPPGDFVVLEVDLRGQLPTDYRLTVAHQPLVNPDHLSVHVDQDGTRLVSIDRTALTTDLEWEDLLLLHDSAAD